MGTRGEESGSEVRWKAATAGSRCSAQEFALYPVGEWVDGEVGSQQMLFENINVENINEEINYSSKYFQSQNVRVPETRGPLYTETC